MRQRRRVARACALGTSPMPLRLPYSLHDTIAGAIAIASHPQQKRPKLTPGDHAALIILEEALPSRGQVIHRRPPMIHVAEHRHRDESEIVDSSLSTDAALCLLASCLSLPAPPVHHVRDWLAARHEGVFPRRDRLQTYGARPRVSLTILAPRRLTRCLVVLLACEPPPLRLGCVVDPLEAAHGNGSDASRGRRLRMARRGGRIQRSRSRRRGRHPRRPSGRRPSPWRREIPSTSRRRARAPLR